MKHARWSKKETDYLQLITGEYPVASLVKKYNDTAKKHNWPPRTRYSIQKKCQQLGLSTVVKDASIIGWADAGRVVGWSRPVTENLIEKSSIRAIVKPFKRGFWYVERKMFAKLVTLRPDLFYGVSRDALYSVIEDMNIVDSIKDYLSSPKKSPYTVICVETGQEWENASIAASQLNVSTDRIQYSIRTKKPIACLGLTFTRPDFLTGKLK